MHSIDSQSRKKSSPSPHDKPKDHNIAANGTKTISDENKEILK